MGLFDSRSKQAKEMHLAAEQTKEETRLNIRTVRVLLNQIDSMVVFDSGEELEPSFMADLLQRTLGACFFMSHKRLAASQWSMINYLLDRNYSMQLCQDIADEAELDDELPEWLIAFLSISQDLGKDKDRMLDELNLIACCYLDFAVSLLLVAYAKPPDDQMIAVLFICTKLMEEGKKALDELWD